MKIAPKFQIERAASDDPTRYVLNSVYLDCRDPAQHLAIATDGRILAAVPIEDVQDSEPGSLIPLDAFKKARKLAGKNGTSEIVSNGVVTFADKSTAPIPEDLKGANFPNWKQVVPTVEPDFAVSIDPHRLMQIAQALGVEKGKSLTLHWRLLGADKTGKTLITQDAAGQPIRITAATAPGGFAVLMPMRTI